MVSRALIEQAEKRSFAVPFNSGVKAYSRGRHCAGGTSNSSARWRTIGLTPPPLQRVSNGRMR